MIVARDEHNLVDGQTSPRLVLAQMNGKQPLFCHTQAGYSCGKDEIPTHKPTFLPLVGLLLAAIDLCRSPWSSSHLSTSEVPQGCVGPG